MIQWFYDPNWSACKDQEAWKFCATLLYSYLRMQKLRSLSPGSHHLLAKLLKFFIFISKTAACVFFLFYSAWYDVSSELVSKSRLMHAEGCQNLLFILGINKALESDADIPAPVHVSPAMERWDTPRSGGSQSLAFFGPWLCSWVTVKVQSVSFMLAFL